MVPKNRKSIFQRELVRKWGMSKFNMVLKCPANEEFDLKFEVPEQGPRSILSRVSFTTKICNSRKINNPLTKSSVAHFQFPWKLLHCFEDRKYQKYCKRGIKVISSCELVKYLKSGDSERKFHLILAGT